MSYRIRVDAKISYEDLMCFFEVFTDLTIVRHDVNDNPHFHAYIMTDKWKSPQSMRYAIRTKFKNLNKTDYSIKLCDETRKDEYIQYLFNRKHGNIPTLLFSTIDTTQHQLRAEQVANDFMEKYQKDHEITQYDISKMLAEYIRTNDTNNKYEIISQCLSLHNKYGKSYTVFSLERSVMTAMGLTDKYKDYVIQQTYDKVFPMRANDRLRNNFED